MQIRCSQTLIFSPQDQSMIGFNFMTQSIFGCTPETFQLFDILGEWIELDAVIDRMPSFNERKLRQNIEQLIEVTAIVEQGSQQSTREDEFNQQWEWGVPLAAYHFSLVNKPYLTIDQVEEMQREKIATVPSPELLTTNEKYSQIYPLQNPLAGDELLQLMAKRRTIRTVSAPQISLNHLSECLFSGLGVTGETKNCVVNLPLTMTPSGGARNPYEAYVYAREVEGLEAGFYHYSALEHSLGRLETSNFPLPSTLLAGQDWADEMPCVIFLVAHYERSMWKYIDPNAYRGVLIEAGHIGQNIMLAATARGLTACPTAAFCHQDLHDCLEIDGATRTAAYALIIGKPGTDEANKLYH